MPEIEREELTKLPYYEGQDLYGRIVQLRSYYSSEDDEWYMYLPVAEGELGRMGGGEVVHGAYFAEEPASPEKDVAFPLGSFVARFTSWQDVAVVSSKMESDLDQLASLFGKLELIANSQSLTDTERSSLLESEIEHLMTLFRSFYDLLQKFSKRLASKVVEPGNLQSRVFQDLPDSFAKIALNGDEPRSTEQISEAYGVHEDLAEFYASEAEHFATFRDIRDGLIHHGKQAPTIFMLDEGPAIDVSTEPWSGLPVWHETELSRDRLGAVRALAADVAKRCLSATTRYVTAFTTKIAVPPPLISDVTLFLRGPYTANLNILDEIIAEPWQ